MVINDMLGMFHGHIPKFVKKFANLQPLIIEALQQYKEEVMAEPFPLLNIASPSKMRCWKTVLPELRYDVLNAVQAPGR